MQTPELTRKLARDCQFSLSHHEAGFTAVREGREGTTMLFVLDGRGARIPLAWELRGPALGIIAEGHGLASLATTCQALNFTASPFRPADALPMAG